MFSKNPLKEFIDKNKKSKKTNRSKKSENFSDKIERSIFVYLIVISLKQKSRNLQ